MYWCSSVTCGKKSEGAGRGKHLPSPSVQLELHVCVYALFFLGGEEMTSLMESTTQDTKTGVKTKTGVAVAGSIA